MLQSRALSCLKWHYIGGQRSRISSLGWSAAVYDDVCHHWHRTLQTAFPFHTYDSIHVAYHLHDRGERVIPLCLSNVQESIDTCVSPLMSVRWKAVRPRPRWGRPARKPAPLRRMWTVCAEIHCFFKPFTSSAVRVAGVRCSHRCSRRIFDPDPDFKPSPCYCWYVPGNAVKAQWHI